MAVTTKEIPMAHRFKVGDHVSWNSEAGRVSGRITEIHEQDFDYKGHPRRVCRSISATLRMPG